MSKQFPHVHSFRLSDSDEQNLTALMKQFNIDFSRDQSAGFRLFLKRLSQFFSDLDSEREGNTPSAAHSHSVAERIEKAAQVPTDEELTEEQSAIMIERGKVGRLISHLAIKELKEEKKRLHPWNYQEKELELRKRLGVPLTNLGVTAAEIKRKYEELRKHT